MPLNTRHLDVFIAPAADYITPNEVFENNTMLFERDTLRVKFGDGIRHWNDLPYEILLVGSSLASLTDTDFTIPPVSGNLLRYNGTKWVPGSDTFALARANHTGTQSADTLTDGTTNKAFLATERTKLAGIATGATANSADATLLNRANHTGTQAESTITNLVSDLAAKMTGNGAIIGATKTKITYDAQGLVTTGADATQDDIGDGTTNKQYPATDKTKLAGIAAGATVNSTDAFLLARGNHTGTQSADTLTDGITNKAFLATERTKLAGIATGATANQTDAYLLARANHTGTQLAATISDFNAAALAAAPAVTLAGQNYLSIAGQVVTANAVDLSGTNVTGILSAANGGTGVNNSTRTLTVNTNAGTLAFPSAATVMTFPSTTATLARTDAAQTFTGVQTFSSTIAGSINGNAATVTTNANLTGDATSVGNATTVVKINGVSLSGLATGILKNTTTTGVPSIAVAADFPTLNQSTTGNATTATTSTNLAGGSGGTIPYQSAAGTTAMLANGTAGQVLQSNGTTVAPSWVAAGVGSVTSVTSANGAATVATTTTTPVITIVSAPILTTARTINGTSFDGSANITVTAAAGTLSGGTLASGVTASSLTSFGTSPTLNTAILTGLPTGSGIASAASVSTLAARDANANLSVNAVITNYATTASAAGTTTLTVGSAYQQYITGALTQTVALPVASTLVVGQQFQVVNNSLGVVTVQSSGGNTVQSMATSTNAVFTCVLAAGTTAASWSVAYFAPSGTGTVTSVTSADANATVATTTTTPVITIVSAPKLQTARAINGTNFDGSAAITITSAAGTLTGATLASGVTASSLTSFGTSPSFTTPLLGTPTSGTLTNCTGLPVAGITASTTQALGLGSVELGHATDTTLSRSAAGVLAVEGVVIPSISSTNTLSNKRITKMTGTIGDGGATPTINTDNVTNYDITAQTVAVTSFTTNLTGTPSRGDTLWISITGTAARAITWGASFEASTVALPTTTVTTARLDVGFIWNVATSKWRVVASA